MPGAQCTRSLVCDEKQTHELVTTGPPEHPAFPHAMVLRLTSRSPRRPGFIVTVVCEYGSSHPGRADWPPQDLTPASGRQNDTTSPSASAPFVCAPVTAHGFKKPALPSSRARGHCRVHRIPPRVRDDRDTPLEWDETSGVMELIWVRGETKYFCTRVLTKPWCIRGVASPSSSSVAWRRVPPRISLRSIR